MHHKLIIWMDFTAVRYFICLIENSRESGDIKIAAIPQKQFAHLSKIVSSNNVPQIWKCRRRNVVFHIVHCMTFKLLQYSCAEPRTICESAFWHFVVFLGIFFCAGVLSNNKKILVLQSIILSKPNVSFLSSAYS